MTFDLVYYQKPGGMIFPDRATMYVAAIEDRQYKDTKINCKSVNLKNVFSVSIETRRYDFP